MDENRRQIIIYIFVFGAKICTLLLKWKIESGKLKIVLNNFPLSIIHFQLKKGRVQIFAPLTFIRLP